MRGKVKITKTEGVLLCLTVLFFAAMGWCDPEESTASGGYEVVARQRSETVAMDKIDLNSATAEELELLDGIGPTLADRIVADRQANGPYAEVEDVLRVKGIGEKTLEKFREYVQVEEIA